MGWWKRCNKPHDPAAKKRDERILLITSVASAIAMLAVSISVTRSSDAAEARADTADHAPFDAQLRKYVEPNGMVRYVAWRDEAGKDLDAYLDALAQVDPRKLSEDARLAFYINLYNAAVIDAVIERYQPGFSMADDDFKIFDEKFVRMGGEKLSLNDLEHQTIRKQYDEPRVHAALVCAAVACPPLWAEAYTDDNIKDALGARMKLFLRDDQRNQIDADQRTLKLSKIFEWFAEDFGGKQSLPRYVDRFVAPDVAGYRVTFLPYDWALNIAE